MIDQAHDAETQRHVIDMESPLGLTSLFKHLPAVSEHSAAAMITSEITLSKAQIKQHLKTVRGSQDILCYVPDS